MPSPQAHLQKSNMDEKPAKWNFAEMWNLGLLQKPRDVFEARDYLWASELYNAPVDLFLKLKGTNPSNLPNDRSMRKFDAGNLTELFVKMILFRVGIYKATQIRVKFARDEMLEVSGKIDFMAGGEPIQSEEVKAVLDALDLPDLFRRQVEAVVNVIKEKYPNGLEDKILEIKSVATFGMNRLEVTQKPLQGHDLQAFHYARGLNKDVELVYICREDLRAWSTTITPEDQDLSDKYLQRLKGITDSYRSDVMPKKEDLILYEHETGKFSSNFRVQYSSYLTMLYGFQHPEEYADWFKKKAGSWNRVLGRVARGQKMTPKNEDILKQIEAEGFDLAFIKENVINLAAQGHLDEEGEEE